MPQIVALDLVIHDALQAIRGKEFLDRLLEAGFVGGAALAVAGLEANGVLREIAQAPAEGERIERVGDEDLAQARDVGADVGLGGRARESVDLADGATHGARSICLAGREQGLDGRIQLAEAVVFLIGIASGTREHDQVDIDGQGLARVGVLHVLLELVDQIERGRDPGVVEIGAVAETDLPQPVLPHLAEIPRRRKPGKARAERRRRAERHVVVVRDGQELEFLEIALGRPAEGERGDHAAAPGARLGRVDQERRGCAIRSPKLEKALPEGVRRVRASHRDRLAGIVAGLIRRGDVLVPSIGAVDNHGRPEDVALSRSKPRAPRRAGSLPDGAKS